MDLKIQLSLTPNEYSLIHYAIEDVLDNPHKESLTVKRMKELQESLKHISEPICEVLPKLEDTIDNHESCLEDEEVIENEPEILPDIRADLKCARESLYLFLEQLNTKKLTRDIPND